MNCVIISTIFEIATCVTEDGRKPSVLLLKSHPDFCGLSGAQIALYRLHLRKVNGLLRKLKVAPGHGFTLVESVMAIALGSLMFAGIYACFAWGFSTVRAARENLRATQIMMKHLESLRLCSFTQLTDTNYCPLTFTDYYDPKDQSAGAGGAVYSGTYSATVPASGTLPESYRTNMLLIAIGVTWTSGNVQRSRSMQTYIAQNGIDSYVSTGQ